MPPALILIIFGLGVLVGIVSWVWNLIVCGRQGALWLLAVLFVPFANLVFLVKFWAEAKRPFFLSLAGLGLMAAPVMMNPRAFSKDLGGRFALHQPAGPPPATTSGPATGPTLSETLQREQAALAETERRQRLAQENRSAYDKHRAEADALFKDLNTRRAKLKVDDAKAVAAFNADAARYTRLLDQTKAEHDSLENPGPVSPAANNGKRAPEVTPPAVATASGGNPPNPGRPAAASASGDRNAPSLPRRALDKARGARDAASAAEDAGPFAGEVYGTNGPGPAPAPSPRR